MRAIRCASDDSAFDTPKSFKTGGGRTSAVPWSAASTTGPRFNCPGFFGVAAKTSPRARFASNANSAANRRASSDKRVHPAAYS